MGELVVARHGDRLCVTRADPQIWIADGVLACLSHPDVEIQGGGVLVINGVNRRVVYRIDCSRQHPLDPALIYAEWPD